MGAVQKSRPLPAKRTSRVEAPARDVRFPRERSDGVGSPARQPNSILSTTKPGMSSRTDDGQELASSAKAVPEQVAGPVEPSTSSFPSAAPGSSPAPLAR